MPTKRPWQHYAKRDDKERNKSKNYDFYNSSLWRKHRARYVAKHKICAYYLQTYPKKMLVPADIEKIPIEIVDHIIPIELGGARYDVKNLQGLTRKANDWKAKQERTTPLYKWTTNEQGDKIPLRDEEGRLILNK